LSVALLSGSYKATLEQRVVVMMMEGQYVSHSYGRRHDHTISPGVYTRSLY